MFNRLKKALFAVVLIAAAVYFYLNFDSLLLLMKIDVKDIAIYLCIVWLSFFILSLQFRNLMLIFGIKLPFNEFFGLTICNTMVSYYAPARSGMIVRAIYLKSKYNFKLSHYAALVTGSYLITFNITAAIGLLVSGLSYFMGKGTSVHLIVLFSVLLIIVISMTMTLKYFAKKEIDLKNEKINSIISRVREGIGYLVADKSAIVKIAALNVIFLLFIALRLYWAFKSLSVEISYLQLISVAALSAFSMVLSLTPGNIGIKEGIISWSATLLGVGLNEAVLAATIDRIMAVVITFSFGLIYSKKFINESILTREKVPHDYR